MASDVSQRAREAAASICSKSYLSEAILSGAVDHASTIQAFARFEAAIRAETALPTILIDPTGKGYPTDERPMTVAEFEAVIRADAAAIERERCAGVAEDELCEIFEDSPEIDSVCNMVVREIATAIRKGPMT